MGLVHGIPMHLLSLPGAAPGDPCRCGWVITDLGGKVSCVLPGDTSTRGQYHEFQSFLSSQRKKQNSCNYSFSWFFPNAAIVWVPCHAGGCVALTIYFSYWFSSLWTPAWWHCVPKEPPQRIQLCCLSLQPRCVYWGCVCVCARTHTGSAHECLGTRAGMRPAPGTVMVVLAAPGSEQNPSTSCGTPWKPTIFGACVSSVKSESHTVPFRVSSSQSACLARDRGSVNGSWF